MKNYIYSYRDILKAIIKYLCLTTTKSKVINPLYIGTRLNCASFEDTIIGYVDCINVLRNVYDKRKIFIMLAIIDGFTEKQIAQVLCCSRQNINKHKHKLINVVRSIQKYDR